MTITVDNVRRELPPESTVRDAVAAFSPFGDEPVIVMYNGARCDPGHDAALAEGDAIAFYPLLVGG